MGNLAGCKLYDFISGKAVVGNSYYLSKEDTLRRLPALSPERVSGAMVMYEGTVVPPIPIASELGSAHTQCATQAK